MMFDDNHDLISNVKKSTYNRRNRTRAIAACTLVLILLSSPAAAWAADSATLKVEQTITDNAPGDTASSKALNAVSDKIPKGAKISSAQAAQNVLNLFPLLSKAKITAANFGVTDSYPVDYDKKWQLNFTFEYGNGSSGFDAKVDGVTGEVLSVHIPERLIQTYSKAGTDKLDIAAAEKIALDWLALKVKGIDPSTLRKSPLYSYNSTLFLTRDFNFVYNVPVKGLLSDSEKVSVSVNYNGEVTGFSRDKAFAEYPSEKPAVSLTIAEQVFRDNLNMELTYLPDRWNVNAPAKYFLGYVPENNTATSIDAKTGKRIQLTNVESTQILEQPEAIPASKGATFTLLRTPLQDGDAAVERLNTLIPFPKDYSVNSTHLAKSWNNPKQQVWNISLRKKQANRFSDESIYAEVERESGKINSYQYGSYESETQEYKPTGKVLSLQEAKARAMEIVQKLVPNAASEYKLTTVYDRDPKVSSSTYYFNFQRYAQGILITNDNIDLNLRSDGEIRSFSASANADIEALPDSKPFISKEEAKKRYLNDVKLELKYEKLGGYIERNGVTPTPVKVNLVYTVVPKGDEDVYYSSFSPIDAVTGEKREVYLPYSVQKLKDAKDTKGHPLEKALREAIQYRVLVPDDEGLVKPDEQITEGEWLSLASKAVNPDLDTYNGNLNEQTIAGVNSNSKYYKALQTFINNRWITIDPDSTLILEKTMTRERLAQYLVEMLGYKKLANFYNQPPDISGVSDVTSILNKGAVSIALKLKLFELKDGKFAPDRIVTRAEAADVLIRLKDLIGKTDRFLENYL